MVTAPRLTEAELPALYSQYYPRRQIDFAALEREAMQVKRPFAAFQRWMSGTDNQGHYLARTGQHVLDIGSGSCLSLLELRNLGIKGSGVEADPNVEAIAKKYNLNVHIGSIHDTPFSGQRYDLITLNQVIEHVPDPRALLRTISGRLTSDGRVALSFPNASSLQRRLSGVRWINWHVPYHQHHFNRRSFKQLSQSEGYCIVSVRSVTPNLWTLLQIRAAATSPDEGVVSAEWSSKNMPSGGKKAFLSRMTNVILKPFRYMVSGVIVLMNRVIDLLGVGDSLIVVIEKAKLK
jgi:2-polyprenyl-3-methyl-5-hydroxy-6-metoxy-1,4-benzoquinol methylase